jgi:hypothetical protein
LFRRQARASGTGVFKSTTGKMATVWGHRQRALPSTKIDRMRILSSAKVVEIAERFARKIADTYSEPNKSFVELQEMINSNSVNLMREFSTTRREELETLRTL